ncbi:YCF48-related protein [Pseudoalteromonas luteoviolacea]|uniref:YCF48-related protein n=1 Tax=Pseudoalteromonas luteoviolacea TaxID=43657 RepID=UPI001F2E8D2B|nr:YCF48-related protein [Pseudoalteromonas luteoviolacea]MCF6440668.1 YCF48-related protein [Pseudoalteromonas luteoviolacea]
MIKKLIATSIAVFVMQSEAIGSASEALRVAHPEKTLLTDIINSGKRLVAVGKHGTIVYSDDGSSWEQAHVPIQSLLTAVEFTSAKRGWACGHDASILNTTDGGVSWQIQQYLPDLEKPCLDIEFVDDKQGFAIGAYGMMYQTQDGGKSWTKRFLNEFVHPDDVEYLAELKQDDPQAYEEETQFILPHFNRMLIDGNDIFLVGEMGLFAVSRDLGTTWTRIDEFYSGSLFAVNKNKQEQLIAAGLRGNTFISDSKDVSFSPINVEKAATINSIVSTDTAQIMLANSGFVFTIEGKNVKTKQLKNGKSILSGVLHNGQLVLATEEGIQTIEVDR